VLGRAATSHEENEETGAQKGDDDGPDAAQAIGKECEHRPVIRHAQGLRFPQGADIARRQTTPGGKDQDCC
jgi:hypothetical protein